MPLSTQTFNQLLQNQAAAIQGTSSALIDFTPGSILLAVIESNASVAMWLQALLLQLLSVTRASTSTGSDLDSWMADFNLTRLPAIPASGAITFARFTTGQQALIPVGTTVSSADGTQTYSVIADSTNVAYNAALNGFVLAANSASVNVTVVAATPGAASNASIGAISILTQSIPYIDTVTNAAAFTNGTDAESDAALRVRFVAYIASLSKATKAAIGYAISTVQQGLSYTLTENAQYNGTTDYGYFYVVVDDGTGTPPAQLLTNVNNAVDLVRGATIRFGVFAPVITTANVSATLTTASGYVHGTLVTAVTTAVTNYINALPLGTNLNYTRLAQVIYDTSPGITDVTALLLNSGTSDITADAKHIIRSGTITIS